MSAAVKRVAIIGGGPAGLMAAESLSGHAVQVDVFDAMPSVGRKFLMAGRGGLNLTHSEPAGPFLARYGARAPQVAPWLAALDAAGLREWAHGLGIQTFVGSSGRVFPEEMKAAPLLRAWLARLRARAARLHMRHRWLGWPADAHAAAGALRFDTPEGEQAYAADAVILALGGGSWAKLGSDGAWLAGLRAHGIEVAPLRRPMRFRRGVVGSFPRAQRRAAGEVGRHGLRGPRRAAAGPARRIRDFGNRHRRQPGLCAVGVPAGPDRGRRRGNRDAGPAAGLAAGKSDGGGDASRGARSMSSHLQSRLGLKGVKAGLLRECATAEDFRDPDRLALRIKALPLKLARPRPIDEAISTAGGVSFDALTQGLMLQAAPGVFCAGEMLDWEAPTGGYLLTACMASGVVAAAGAMAFLGGTQARDQELDG